MAQLGGEKPWRLMVGLDGSPHSHKAFERALSLARNAQQQAELYLLAVVEPGVFVAKEAHHLHAATKAGAAASSDAPHAVHSAHRLLEPFEEQCRQAQVSFVPVVAEAMSVKEEICRQVEHHHVDLLLLGTRGLGSLSRLLLGSVTDYCTQHATCDVLVVR